MKTAKYVSELINNEKSQGKDLQVVAWDAALACVGWAYVFGARGNYCDPVNRRNAYASHGADHPTIKSACINFNGSDQTVGNCEKCKWYPGGRTRFYDCRGFTYWILKQVFGWELMGAGATSQWSNGSNWSSKGTIDTMPKNTLCCLFVEKGKKMEHTGFGFNNETIECSAGVQHYTQRKAKWTHWGVPVCISGATPTPPEPTPETKPTLRRGDKGAWVTLAQTELKNKGYDLGSYGVDGNFGKATEAAVRKLQTDFGLVSDGIIGNKTWSVLDSSDPVQLYTVTIAHLTATEADSVLNKYPGATKTPE